ncbi:chaperone protein DnaJ 11, chloroplastic [Tanacetum coccineum]
MRPPITAVHVATKAATLYDVLRVERTATITEIKKAFRNLAKVYHPDVGYEKNGGGDGEFIEIRNAYVTLSDPVAREVYDMKARRRSAVAGERRGFYGCRRWETDQCW